MKDSMVQVTVTIFILWWWLQMVGAYKFGMGLGWISLASMLTACILLVVWLP